MTHPHAGLQGLHRFAAHESRSIIQYLLGAFPWASSAHLESVARVQALIETERDSLANLTRHLYRQGLPPIHTGGYPTDFTSLNFIDLNHLLPLLVREEQESIVRLRDALGPIEQGEIRQLGQELLELKKKHLEELQRLAKPEPAVMS